MSELGPACKLPAGWSETAVARAVDAASARLAVDEALRAAHRPFHEALFWFLVRPGLCRVLHLAGGAFFSASPGKRSDGEIGLYVVSCGTGDGFRVLRER